jgi:hypothetical protein
MAQSLTRRRVHGAGKGFGIFMIAIVVFLALLILYFKNHSSPGPTPTRPQGIFGQLRGDQMLPAVWRESIS